ncbi:hypothetical protein KF728_29615 [Candidatus Obscuribacterales bacterium]|nr:hypothetical protein [Candidatus Obscuribacterales bacterium]MBX3154347.1 hypothetical protein [Candidatus Obscuribacterales bacterium]
MKNFEDWLDLPLIEITKDMIEQRHQELASKTNRLNTSGHGLADVAMKKLRAIFTFAMGRYGTDDGRETKGAGLHHQTPHFNHSIKSDVTSQYLVLDLDNLRKHMNAITRTFLELFGLKGKEKSIVDASMYVPPSEVIQLKLPLNY